jgi:hypothetical protein
VRVVATASSVLVTIDVPACVEVEQKTAKPQQQTAQTGQAGPETEETETETDTEINACIVIDSVTLAGQQVLFKSCDTTEAERSALIYPLVFRVVEGMHAPLRLVIFPDIKRKSRYYREKSPVITSDGTLFLPNAFESNVLVFAADGTFVRTILTPFLSIPDSYYLTTSSASFVKNSHVLLWASYCCGEGPGIFTADNPLTKMLAWNTQTNTVLWKKELPVGCKNIAVLSPDVMFISDCFNNELHAYNVDDCALISSISVPPCNFIDVDATTSTVFLLTTLPTIPKMVLGFRWNGTTLELDAAHVHDLKVWTEGPTSLAVIPSSRVCKHTCLAVGLCCTLRVLSLPDYSLVCMRQFDAHITCLTADPAGRALAVSCVDDIIHVLPWPLSLLP